MKSRPIIMTTEMVNALLKGRKTKTRRDRGLNKINQNPDNYTFKHLFDIDYVWYACFANSEGEIIEEIRCPYGIEGDKLWVKEAFMFDNEAEPNIPIYKGGLDAKTIEEFTKYGLKWKSPLFMPYCYRRFELDITDIRVERLQDITEEEAEAEGVFYTTSNLEYQPIETTAIEAYKALFDKINGAGQWDKNPWVWVIDFVDATRSIILPN